MKTTKLTACLLAAALCLGLFPAAAFAAKADDKVPRLRNSAFDYREGAALARLTEAAESFPDAYDLRHVKTDDGEVSYVTPVRLQNPYGTCWGFAVAGAAESSLLSSGVAQELGYDADTLDLSEKQIAFFATSYISDPDDPQYGEGMHFREIPEEQKNTYAYRYNTGGFSSMGWGVFTSGSGPILEKRWDPESGALVEDPIFSYRGKRGEAAYWESATEYDANNDPVPESYRSVPVWYSDEDDWSVPEEYRFYQDFRLRDAMILPSPAGYDENGTYVFQPEAVDAVKEQISQHHRALSIDFCAESYLPGQDTSGKKYMSPNWAHFTNVFEYANHAVTIVGYDDHYPKENFCSTTENGGSAQPEGDGAFLVKNSWGSELNDFPANGYRHWGLLDGLDGVPYDASAEAKEGMRATGYFWISYYDRSIGNPTAFVFDKCVSDNGYYVEQHDLMNGTLYPGYWSDEEEYAMANVFTAEATSALSDVSILTATPGTTVRYEVYLLGEGYADPQDGILIEEGEQFFDYGGIHRFELKAPVVLAKGQQYSVVIKEEIGDWSIYCFNAEYSDSGPSETYYESVINEGESYFFKDAHWGDLAYPEVQEALLAEYAEYGLLVDNLQIKTYLEPIVYPDGYEEDPVFEGYLTVHHWQENNPGTFSVAAGEDKTLTAEFRGLGSEMPASWDPVFSWEVVDEDVLEVSTDTPKRGTAVIKGLKQGVTQLIVRAGDGESADCYGVRVLTIVVDPGANDTWLFGIEDTVMDNGPAVTAWINCGLDDTVTACGARFDADGRFLGMEMMELASGERNSLTVLRDGADSICFYALDETGTPFFESVTVPLSEEPAEMG